MQKTTPSLVHEGSSNSSESRGDVAFLRRSVLTGSWPNCVQTSGPAGGEGPGSLRGRREEEGDGAPMLSVDSRLWWRCLGKDWADGLPRFLSEGLKSARGVRAQWLYTAVTKWNPAMLRASPAPRIRSLCGFSPREGNMLIPTDTVGILALNYICHVTALCLPRLKQIRTRHAEHRHF